MIQGKHFTIFISVGQHNRLEDLARELQVVSTKTLHKCRIIHEGNPTIATHDSHRLSRWWPGEQIKGDVRSRSFCIKVQRSLRTWKHKLFGIWRQLAEDRRCQRVHGERKRSVLHQAGRGNGAGRARHHPLLLNSAGTGGVSAHPYLCGAKFGCSKACCSEGDGLRYGM